MPSDPATDGAAKCDLPPPQVCLPGQAADGAQPAAAESANAETATGPVPQHGTAHWWTAPVAPTSPVNVAAGEPPADAADTVTKRSDLIYSDNMSGCYRWTWTDSFGRRSASPPGVCGYDMYLHEICYNCPTGTITGSAYWFPGADGTQHVIPIQQNTQWSSSSAGWWEFASDTSLWFWFSCSYRSATSNVAAGWNCQMFEEDPNQPGHLLPDGNMTLFLTYGHAGN